MGFVKFSLPPVLHLPDTAVCKMTGSIIKVDDFHRIICRILVNATRGCLMFLLIIVGADSLHKIFRDGAVLFIWHSNIDTCIGRVDCQVSQQHQLSVKSISTMTVGSNRSIFLSFEQKFENELSRKKVLKMTKCLKVNAALSLTYLSLIVEIHFWLLILLNA